MDGIGSGKGVVVGVSIAILVAVLSIAGRAVGGEARQAIPLLSHPPDLTIERDMPKAVQARLERAQREAFERLRAVSRKQPSRAAGCTANDFPGSLGPPAPDVDARVLGRNVEVVVRFRQWPRSPACRPSVILVSTRGAPLQAGMDALPWTESFQLRGPVGRAVIRLPMYSKAPYELLVRAETIQGRASKLLRRPLACPSGGCLQGESWTSGGTVVPRPVFRLRGISLTQLETSFRDGLSAGLTPPFQIRAAGCRSLTACEVTYADPLFPREPYRIRYRIGGEQVSGCWATLIGRRVDPVPYDDTHQGSGPSGGCAAWLR